MKLRELNAAEMQDTNGGLLGSLVGGTGSDRNHSSCDDQGRVSELPGGRLSN